MARSKHPNKEIEAALVHAEARDWRIEQRMNTYEFTLKFAFPGAHVDTDALVERLAQCGCEDALVGIGLRGRIALDFSRESRSAERAMLSAIKDIKSAIPDARFIEASPDLVGIADVAQILGCTRQNVRKFVIQNAATFPSPVHEGSASIYRLSKVLVWALSRGRPVDPLLMETAEVAGQVNLAREAGDRRPSLQAKIERLVSGPAAIAAS